MEWVSRCTVRYGLARQLKLPEGCRAWAVALQAHENCGMYVFCEICTASGSGPTNESGCWWGKVYGSHLLKVSRELIISILGGLTGLGVWVPNTAPTKKGASSCLSRSAAIRDTIGVPHTDLVGSTSRIHSLNGRTEQYFPTRHTFVS